MDELAPTPETEPTPPQLKRSIIETIARKIYAERLNCGGGVDCFSGGDPTPLMDDEDDLIRRFLGQAMGSATKNMRDIPTEVAIAQYKQAIEQAGGLDQFIAAATERRDAPTPQQATDLATERPVEAEAAPDRQAEEAPTSGQKLGGSAMRRLFRR